MARNLGSMGYVGTTSLFIPSHVQERLEKTALFSSHGSCMCKRDMDGYSVQGFIKGYFVVVATFHCLFTQRPDPKTQHLLVKFKRVIYTLI